MSNGPLTITIEGDDALARALRAAPDDLERVIDSATDDAREPMGDAFYAETHVITGDLRAANELIAGPGFRMTHINEMEYASFEDARHHFVARSVERAERGVIAVYDAAIEGFTRTFGGPDGQ